MLKGIAVRRSAMQKDRRDVSGNKVTCYKCTLACIDVRRMHGGVGHGRSWWKWRFSLLVVVSSSKDEQNVVRFTAGRAV